jgi:hypothetical protein
MTPDGLLYAALYLAAAALLVRAWWPRRRPVQLPPPRSGEEHARPLFLPAPHARDAASRWLVRHGYASPRWGLRARVQRRILAAGRRGAETVDLPAREAAEFERWDGEG